MNAHHLLVAEPAMLAKRLPFRPSRPGPLPPHAAVILELQRAVGNQALQRLLLTDAAGQTGIPLQRVLVNLRGADEEATYQQRASQPTPDFHAGARNRGWVKVDVPGQGERVEHAASTHGQKHTEEQLIEWVQSQGIALAEDPAATDRPRITAVYTERKPCDAGNADLARQSRSPGNCDDLIKMKLHPAVPVSYSVRNVPADHAELLYRQDMRHRKETALQDIATMFVAKISAGRRAGGTRYQTGRGGEAFRGWVAALNGARKHYRDNVTDVAVGTSTQYATVVAAIRALVDGARNYLRGRPPP